MQARVLVLTAAAISTLLIAYEMFVSEWRIDWNQWQTNHHHLHHLRVHDDQWPYRHGFYGRQTYIALISEKVTQVENEYLLNIVHSLHCSGGISVICESDKSKSTRPSGITILDDDL